MDRSQKATGEQMRVALLSYGFGEYCVRFASALAREAQVLLVLPDDLLKAYVSLLDNTVEVYTFQKPRLRQPLRQLLAIHAIIRRIREFRPDVLHLQQGHLWFNIALPLVRRYPLVVTIKDPRVHLGDRDSARTPQLMWDIAYRRADQIIVHADALRHTVVAELRIPSDRVHVISLIALGDPEAAIGCEEEDLVLFFGRIWPYKGLEYLIRAEPLIAEQVPGVRIIIAGRGEDLTRYKRLMVHPERFVIHNEYVSDERRADLFRRASIVVLPYVEATQTGVIPLAYTFAKPVVATRVGGLPEMVDHGSTGYVVPPRDEGALADAIVRLLRDTELRRRLGQNAKHKVHTQLAADVTARQTLAVYDRAIQDHAER